jgi:hypothetical protein
MWFQGDTFNVVQQKILIDVLVNKYIGRRSQAEEIGLWLQDRHFSAPG